MSRPLVSAILTAFLGACATSDVDPQQTRETIEKLGIEMTQAANALDADKFMGYFARDTGVIIVGDGSMVVGWDAAARGQREYWAELFRATYDIGRTRVSVLGPDIAIATNSGTALEVPRIGEQRRGHFVSTVVWQRRSGRWRVIQVHESTSP